MLSATRGLHLCAALVYWTAGLGPRLQVYTQYSTLELHPDSVFGFLQHSPGVEVGSKLLHRQVTRLLARLLA